jgi:Kef-type K+ transport system membrane component KefB/Trk K+ transport system NAD-binding subunit
MGLSSAGESVGLTQNPILMGLILSTTSLGIVVPVLKERGLTTTSYGQAVLVSALVGDFVTLILLSLVIAIISHGFSLDLLLFMALLAAFVTAAKISRRVDKVPVLSRIAGELSHATSQIRVRGALALMVIWVVLAESFGVEVILGAFLAGAIMSMSTQSKEAMLREKLDAIGYGFFIPIFFINVGAEFDLRALLVSRTALILAPFLIVAAFLVKMIPALIYRSVFGWRQTLAAGALLSSRLSLIIAASAIALNLGVITNATNSAIVLVAVVTCTFSPMLFSHIFPSIEVAKREGVVILGTEQLAVLLGQRLREAGEQVTFIGRDQAQLERLKQLGFGSVEGNPDHEDVLEHESLQKARALVAISTAPDILLSVCRLARERFEIPVVIARADDPPLVRRLQALNVRVVQPAMAVALALEGALHFPAAFEMLLDKADDVDLMDVPLGNPGLVGRPLRQVRLPGNALVIGIQREGEVVVPHGDTVLKRGDTLVLVGSPESLREARLTLDSAAPTGTPANSKRRGRR